MGCSLAMTGSPHRFFNDSDEDDDGDNDREDDPGWLVQESQGSAVAPVCCDCITGLLAMGTEPAYDCSLARPLLLTYCRLRC
jgi:hypothetical protein